MTSKFRSLRVQWSTGCPNALNTPMLVQMPVVSLPITPQVKEALLAVCSLCRILVGKMKARFLCP